MEAISMTDNIATVNKDRWIGCGICVTSCESNAVQLLKRGKQRVPPKDHDALYKKIMMERFGPLGLLKTITNISLGRKT
jgi:Na+-translocating ferredoxin:NAD+ oxidoreductase subunit B